MSGDDPLEATGMSQTVTQSRAAKAAAEAAQAPAPAQDVSDEAMIGRTIAGKYRVEKLIAKGGMGRVFLATQQPLERKVAVKVLAITQEAKQDPQLVRRFYLEAAVCAKLSHPNIVTVHDYGEAEDGMLFMAMEYLDGAPLSSVVKDQGAIPPARLLPMAIQMCRALRAAHALNIVHRDLKPGNIILLNPKEDEAQDTIKVLDFGLVKVFEAEGAADSNEGIDLTRTGTLLGSPRFMSPEQVRSESLDARSDIYSLGAVIYNLAAGRPPFDGKTIVDVLHQHLHKDTPPIEGLPASLMAVISKAMQKSRDDRYATVADMLGDLKIAYREVVPRGSLDAGPRTASSSGSIPGGVLDSSASRSIDGVASGALQPRAAAFTEPGASLSNTSPGLALDSTQSQALGGAAPGGSSKRGLILAGVGLLAALGLGAILLGREPPRETPPAPTPMLLVDSEPQGAMVLEGGRPLGKTPLTIELDPRAAKTLEITLEGHKKAVLMQPPTTTNARLFASLEPLAPPPPSPVAEVPIATPSATPVKAPRPSKSAKPTEPANPDIRFQR